MGESAGLTFWKVGGVGIWGGNWPPAAVMAACTSNAAPSRLRLRLNWIVMLLCPREFVDVIESMPAIVENCFSNGVATEEAIVSGLAPGREALTKIVGKSTFGRSLTGRTRYAKMPKIKTAAMTRVVIIGRRMKSSERLKARLQELERAEFQSRYFAPSL